MISETSSLVLTLASRNQRCEIPQLPPDLSLIRNQSPFLDLLFKYQCIRTQKKQKVFYWWAGI